MTTTLSQMFEVAAILGWKDVMRNGTGSMQVEHHQDDAGLLEYVKIWASSMRGHWDLVCDYGSRGTGLNFANGFYSADMTAMLDLVVRNQRSFSDSKPGRVANLIQVSLPTEAEQSRARSVMGEAMVNFLMPQGEAAILAACPDRRLQPR